MSRFLPGPLAAALRFMGDMQAYLKWIVGLQILALVVFVLAVFSTRLLSSDLGNRVFDGLAIVGGVSSIIGLLLTFYLMDRASRRN